MAAQLPLTRMASAMKRTMSGVHRTMDLRTGAMSTPSPVRTKRAGTP